MIPRTSSAGAQPLSLSLTRYDKSPWQHDSLSLTPATSQIAVLGLPLG
jgi:hypothetical protein